MIFVFVYIIICATVLTVIDHCVGVGMSIVVNKELKWIIFVVVFVGFAFVAVVTFFRRVVCCLKIQRAEFKQNIA